MADIAKHIIFAGRVQGVGFRFTAYNAAKRHQLTGFVRNLSDGTVEMLTQGHPDDIQDAIEDITVSFSGRIDTNIQEVPINPAYSEFKITF